MSIWTRITDVLSAIASGQGLSDVFAQLRTPPEQRAGFAIAVIALGAKMAKADGRVTRDEVNVFKKVFVIPEGDEKNAARVFNLARQDVAGFDLYAKRIKAMFGEAGHDRMCHLLEGLFHIAMADGVYHPGENEFLVQVAKIFGIGDVEFERLRARVVPESDLGDQNAYAVLGVSPADSLEDIRAIWRKEVKRLHPDNLHARGLPAEAIAMAEAQLIAVNRAWDAIQQDRV